MKIASYLHEEKTYIGLTPGWNFLAASSITNYIGSKYGIFVLKIDACRIWETVGFPANYATFITNKIGMFDVDVGWMEPRGSILLKLFLPR